MLGKPRIRLNNLETSLRFPYLCLSPIMDSVIHAYPIILTLSSISFSGSQDYEAEQFVNRGYEIYPSEMYAKSLISYQPPPEYYYCPKCTVTFIRKSNFDSHSCNLIRNFTCELCNKKFTRKWVLKRHVETLHADHQ